MHGYEFSLKNGESPFGYINDTFDVKVENGEVFVSTTPRHDAATATSSADSESDSASDGEASEAEELPEGASEQTGPPGELSFVRVAALTALEEGRGKFVEAGSKKVALFKVDGEVYAVDDVCPHMGGPLSDGFVEGKSVMCGWHAWEFSLESGECQLGMCIPTYEVKIEGDDIQVGVES